MYSYYSNWINYQRSRLSKAPIKKIKTTQGELKNRLRSVRGNFHAHFSIQIGKFLNFNNYSSNYFSSAGGGGERTLFSALISMKSKFPNAKFILYIKANMKNQASVAEIKKKAVVPLLYMDNCFNLFLRMILILKFLNYYWFLWILSSWLKAKLGLDSLYLGKYWDQLYWLLKRW